jgi:signal transduction histidine kinase
MANLVRQLLELAKADAGEMKPQKEMVDLRALVADVVEELPGSTDIHVDLAETPIRVSVDPAQIARALVNLIENARRYSPDGSPISVSVSSTDSHARISVQDQGEGIEEEHLAHVTERFYRADAARAREAGGTGLGLAIVTEIMKAHEGSLEIESEIGKGTTAVLVVPLNAN